MAQRAEVGEGRGVDGLPRWGSGVAAGGVGLLVVGSLLAASVGSAAAALVVARAASVVGVLVAPGW